MYAKQWALFLPLNDPRLQGEGFIVCRLEAD